MQSNQNRTPEQMKHFFHRMNGSLEGLKNEMVEMIEKKFDQKFKNKPENELPKYDFTVKKPALYKVLKNFTKMTGRYGRVPNV
mgnify:CR=1 FL=1